MIYVQQHIIAGEAVWVVLAQPNKDGGLALSVAYETEVQEGRTGVGSRRPIRAVPRFNLSYGLIADEVDLVKLRNMFGDLDGKKVLLPIWTDRTGTGDPCFSSQVKVGWDEGFTNVAIGEGGTTPAGATVAPAVIGWIERPKENYLTGKLNTLTLKLPEDSPWAQRLDIAAAEPASFSFKPDWVSPPMERTRDRMDFEQIGSGRESSPGGDVLTTHMQKARFNLKRSELIDLLGWFKARRGSFGAFAMQSFIKPGADTPQAPHNFDGTGGRGYMRFAEDHLKLRFIHSQRCIVECSFEQVLDTTTEEHAGFARLFEIYSDADPTDVARLTDADDPVTAGGYTWTPARIEMPRFRSSLKLEKDYAEIYCHGGDVPQLAPIVNHETDIPVRCRVYDANRATDPATTTVLTFGRASGWKLKGPRIGFKVKPFGGLLERKIGRLHFSRNCNYSVFDAACRRNRPTAMDPAAWAVNGVFATQWGASTIRVHSLTGVPGAMADEWFQYGWAEVGTGLDKQVRVVTSSKWFPGGDGWNDAYGDTPVLHLKLQRPVRTDIVPAGSSIVMYPGCDGSFATCKNKFGNGQVYCGAPYAPSYIESKPRGMKTPGK